MWPLLIAGVLGAVVAIVWEDKVKAGIPQLPGIEPEGGAGAQAAPTSWKVTWSGIGSDGKAFSFSQTFQSEPDAISFAGGIASKNPAAKIMIEPGYPPPIAATGSPAGSK